MISQVKTGWQVIILQLQDNMFACLFFKSRYFSMTLCSFVDVRKTVLSQFSRKCLILQGALLFEDCVQANGLSNKHNQDHDLQSDSNHFRFCLRKTSEHEKWNSFLKIKKLYLSQQRLKIPIIYVSENRCINFHKIKHA